MAEHIPKHVLAAERQRRNRRRGVLEDLESIFGAAPLLEGEDELAYQDLAYRMRTALPPRDVIDEIYVRDVVDLQWEIMRRRRALAHIQNTATRRAALRLIRSADLDLGRRLEEAGEPDAKIYSALKSLGIPFEQAHGEGLAQCLGEVERISALVIKTENRRDAMIREFERRRNMTEMQKVLTGDRGAASPAAWPASVKTLPKPEPK